MNEANFVGHIYTGTNIKATITPNSTNSSASTVDVTEVVNEFINSFSELPVGEWMLALAITLGCKYSPGNYTSHNGTGKYDIYWDDDETLGGIRMHFATIAAEFMFVEDFSSATNMTMGIVTNLTDSGTEVFHYVAGEKVGYQLTGLTTPTEDDQAANKKYVDETVATKIADALAAIPIAEERSYG